MTENQSKLELIRRGPMIGGLVQTCMRLGIPEMLADGDKSLDELAARTFLHPNQLESLLLGLECTGFIKRNRTTDLWSNSQNSSDLLEEPLRSRALYRTLPENYKSLSNFVDSMTTEKSASEIFHRKPLSKVMSQEQGTFEIFQNYVNGNLVSNLDDALGVMDFTGSKKILEIGGGDGSLTMQIAKECRHADVAVLEMPENVKVIKENISKHNMLNKIQVIQGNYNLKVPPDFDTLILRNVMHELSDFQAKVVLKNCRESLEAGGKMFIIEALLDRSSPHYKALRFQDIEMMTQVNGKERSAEQFEELLGSGGFTLLSVTQASSRDYVLVAEAL